MGLAEGLAVTFFLVLPGLIVPVGLLLISPVWSLCILSKESSSKSKGAILVGVNLLTIVPVSVFYAETLSRVVSEYRSASHARDENERRFNELVQTHHRVQSIEVMPDKNHKGIQIKAMITGGRSGDYDFRLKLGWMLGATPEPGIREIFLLDGSACNRDQISLQSGTDFLSCLIPCAGLKDLSTVPNQELFKGGFTFDTNIHRRLSSQGHIYGHEDELHKLGQAHITVDAPWLNEVHNDCKSESE